MAVRVRIPMNATERVTFVLSPFLETFWSLHVLREPEHHRLNQGWVRAARPFTASLRTDIAHFAFAFRGSPTSCGIPLPGVALGSFDEELARLRAASHDQALRFFTRPFYEGAEPIAAHGTPDRVAERLLAFTRSVRASTALAERALLEPQVVLGEFAGLIERYWRSIFAERWAHYAPMLQEAANDARGLLREGIEPLLRTMAPEVRLASGGEGFVVARAHDHDVTIGPKDHLVLTPSFFVWPHVRVSCEQPGTVAIAFGPRTELARVASIPPPDSLLMLLDVLADETRLRVIRYLASRGPRSTQELSAFVGVSEPTLSGHLRKLEVAGVVTSKRDGYYVLYELNANVSDAVSRALRGYLESAV